MAAQKAGLDVFVSTEDDEIAEVAINYQANVIDRPAYLAQDDSSTEDVVRHAIKEHGLEKRIVLLQCTSPLCRSEDIQAAIRVHAKRDSVFSGYLCPDICLWKKQNSLRPVTSRPDERKPRQECPQYIVENGAIYAFDRAGFLRHNCRLYGDIGVALMPKALSLEIDDFDDVSLADIVLQSRGFEHL